MSEEAGPWPWRVLHRIDSWLLSLSFESATNGLGESRFQDAQGHCHSTQRCQTLLHLLIIYASLQHKSHTPWCPALHLLFHKAL